MKSLKEYLAEAALPTTTKYIAVIYDDATHENLRKYCSDNGFDLTVGYSGNSQDVTDFEFHTTIFYSTSEHKIENRIIPEPPTTVEVIGVDYLGENNDVPVLKISSTELLEIRDYYISKYNMRDQWGGDYIPHISLSYNRTNLPNIEDIKLPNFPLVFNMRKIENGSEE